MGLFNNQTQGMSKKELAENSARTSRFNILIVVILTALNIVMFLFGAESYFLFSAALPYYSVVFSAVFVAEGIVPPALFYLAIAFAVIILAAYTLCFVMGKKHFGWIIAALALFCADTLFFIVIIALAFESSMIIDIILHLYVLATFISALVNSVKLKNEIAEQPENTKNEQTEQSAE